MKDFQLTKHNLDQLFFELRNELAKEPVIVVSSQVANTGKWGMAKLWRMWMSATADFMAQNGVTMPLMINKDGTYYGNRIFNAEDAHLLFTSQWLGVDKYGSRLSWSKHGHDGMRAATKGERWNALLKHEQWSVERGISLFHPRGSEYEKLTDEQNS